MQDGDSDARAKRESVFRNALVTVDDIPSPIECRVRNVSETGVGVSHKGELSGGMRVRVSISKLPEKDAKVAWATDTQAGISFSESPVATNVKFDDGPNVGAGWLVDLDNPYKR